MTTRTLKTELAIIATAGITGFMSMNIAHHQTLNNANNISGNFFAKIATMQRVCKLDNRTQCVAVIKQLNNTPGQDIEVLSNGTGTDYWAEVK
jgi:hypothetical protein